MAEAGVLPVTRPMHDHSSMTQLTCSECGRVSEDGAQGWQGHLADLDVDGQDEVAFFCAECATREFGLDLDLPDGMA